MNERDFIVVGIVEKSKSFDFSIMPVFWFLVLWVRNSVVLEVCLLFLVACFFIVHEHYFRANTACLIEAMSISLLLSPFNHACAGIEIKSHPDAANFSIIFLNSSIVFHSF